MSDAIDKHKLGSYLADLYRNNRDIITKNDTAHLTRVREKAFECFLKQGFPNTSLEGWRHTDLEKALAYDYTYMLSPEEERPDISRILQCEVPDFDTYLIAMLNGWYLFRNKALVKFNNGVIVGSLAKAIEEYPKLVEAHFNKYAAEKANGLVSLNTSFAADGIFIYVPDNVQVERTIQMVNVINLSETLMVQTRNLVILGKNSSLTLVQCDDSHNHNRSLNNGVTEIFLDEKASIDHYKMQNINDNSTHLNTTFFHLEKESKLSSNVISLNGGLIRNESYARLNGQYSEANIYGLYLMDKVQHVDNQVYVHHAVPNCTSNELFKGIIDDQARSVFKGHILVDKDAQKTKAFQNNKNILLTDKAKANTKPFLEIYADDVKCSHGATVGQLDQTALFYLRSRGMSYDNARMLLMYAFIAEVINKINIKQLHDSIDDMVKKRLRGELSICEQCVLNCKNKEQSISFDIDISKL